ncbi:MAG: hypothetical protein R2706_18370 [Acidimicrobiales bacterium]
MPKSTLLGASTERGSLKLDELITKQYTLDEINEGYQDMRDGRHFKSVA